MSIDHRSGRNTMHGLMPLRAKVRARERKGQYNVQRHKKKHKHDKANMQFLTRPQCTQIASCFSVTKAVSGNLQAAQMEAMCLKHDCSVALLLRALAWAESVGKLSRLPLFGWTPC